jgi:hypothetical protein
MRASRGLGFVRQFASGSSSAAIVEIHTAAELYEPRANVDLAGPRNICVHDGGRKLCVSELITAPWLKSGEISKRCALRHNAAPRVWISTIAAAVLVQAKCPRFEPQH